MLYEQEQVIKAFDIYAQLAEKGKADKDMVFAYQSHDGVRGLVDEFADRVDCVIFVAGDQLYMIPTTRLSSFHVNNEYLRRTYIKGQGTNADLYMMYFCTICLLGEFYDSYQSYEPTRNFITIEDWVTAVNQRIEVLSEHDEEQLKAWEKEYSYQWSTIIEKWEQMDDIKETAKRQMGNTISRMSFIDTVRRFMSDQELIEDIGNCEVRITEKTKTVVQRYFMDLDYNRGILDFIYNLNHSKELTDDAINLQNQID